MMRSSPISWKRIPMCCACRRSCIRRRGRGMADYRDHGAELRANLFRELSNALPSHQPIFCRRRAATFRRR